MTRWLRGVPLGCILRLTDALRCATFHRVELDKGDLRSTHFV